MTRILSISICVFCAVLQIPFIEAFDLNTFACGWASAFAVTAVMYA